MKKKTTIPGQMQLRYFIYIGFVLITLSCSKQESMHKNDSITNENLTSAAKRYYHNQLRVKASQDSMDIDISLYQPDWEKAVQVKTKQGLDLLGVPLKRSKDEYFELNIVAKENNVYGVIKRYDYANNKFYYYSGSGRLKGTGIYDEQTNTFRQTEEKMFSTMDFSGGELEEVVIDGGGGGDIVIGIPSGPTVPNNNLGGGGTATWSSNVVVNLPPPEITIEDVSEYFKCFNLQQNATLTVYVDQPTANSATTWSGPITQPNVGHTFIAIEQGDIVRVYGFYPSEGVKPLTSPSAPSILGNNGGHAYDVKISKQITASQLKNIINASKNYASTYDLDNYNCTDFGISIAAQGGISLPQSTGSWPGGGGHNPGNLGQDLRNMTAPTGAAIQTTGGNAISNQGTCN